jgi:hypothetical protein
MKRSIGRAFVQHVEGGLICTAARHPRRVLEQQKLVSVGGGYRSPLKMLTTQENYLRLYTVEKVALEMQFLVFFLIKANMAFCKYLHVEGHVT